MSRNSTLRKPLKISPKVWAVAGGALVVIGAVNLLIQNSANIGAATEEFIAKSVGAKVEKILVQGSTYSDHTNLRGAIALAKGDSLVGYDAAAARTRLEELPWVKTAAVKRQLPSSVKVEVFEYQPLAVLEEGETYWVVNKDGHRIAEADERFGELPKLTGAGAAEAAANLFANLVAYPNFTAQLFQANFVGERRWDLVFKSGVVVKLPEDGMPKALTILAQLEERRHVIALPKGMVDLRLSDKIVLQLPEDVDINKLVL